MDFMFRITSNFYIGPAAVFDYIYGHKQEKIELWNGMVQRTSNVSLGFSVLYDSRDFLTNAYKGFYMRLDQYRTYSNLLSPCMERRSFGWTISCLVELWKSFLGFNGYIRKFLFYAGVL